MGRSVQLLKVINGPFQEPEVTWQVECWRADDGISSFAHTRLLSTTIAAIQRAEEKDMKRHLAHILFFFPATFRFRIARLTSTTYTVVVSIDVSLRGNTQHATTKQQLTPIEQAIKICNFFEFLLYQEHKGRKPWPKEWPFMMPGEVAYIFWVNALLSRYCEFWGVQ